MTIIPFLPIGIGTLPHHDPEQASQIILKYFPESPYWPQLPSREWKEVMYVQFSEGMPGRVIEGEKVYFRSPFHPASEWERFHEIATSENLDHFRLGEDYASGFHALLKLLRDKQPFLIKGQVTGPITLGLSLLDEKKIPILYDPNLKEMFLKTIASKARWQEREFRRIAPEAETLIFFDEPILSSYGSISMNVGREEIIECLKSAISLLQGLSGIHICGGTDWSIIMETGIRLIHFDAYRYFSNMLAYASELKEFLIQGGLLGWGIVPSEEEPLQQETASGLLGSLEEKIRLFVKEGIPEEIIIKNSLISQSCGLASVSTELAEKALALTKAVSSVMRKRI